jgi:hypothetical protein
MALFNLTDITFSNSKGPTGSLAPLATSGYESNTYRYPEDLGSTDKAHYIVFNINEQRMTSYPGKATNTTPTTIANNLMYKTAAAGTTTLMQNLGQATEITVNAVSDVATEYGGALGGVVPNVIAGGASQLKAELLSGAKALAQGSIRAERRITDTVALYMPDTLAYSSQQKYDTPGAGGQALTALASAGKSVLDTIQTQKGGALGAGVVKNLSPFIASMLAKSAGNLGQIAFSQAYGVVQNPMLEVLYSSPEFRTFRFDFMFYPRSEKESTAVQNIIERFRFHQSPEVNTKFGNGFFMVPPSEFDISFYYNGKINPNIPRISTCVMETMDVDYAPNGFSAYEVPGESAQYGRTGMPVAIRMSLQFKETEIMTKTTYMSPVGQEVRSLGGGNINDPTSDYNTGANGWGSYGE